MDIYDEVVNHHDTIQIHGDVTWDKQSSTNIPHTQHEHGNIPHNIVSLTIHGYGCE